MSDAPETRASRGLARRQTAAKSQFRPVHCAGLLRASVIRVEGREFDFSDGRNLPQLYCSRNFQSGFLDIFDK
jgi:hypothetical protein